jgi:uncharacterized membrane protein
MLSSLGLSGPGSFLYAFFSKVCHQFEERSFHIDGYKLAVCIRCAAIYFGFLLSLILLSFTKNKRAVQAPPRIWFFIALAPVVIDVFLSGVGLLASTSMSRLITGGLLGLVLPPYIVPPLLEAVTQIHSRFLYRGGFHAGKTE